MADKYQTREERRKQQQSVKNKKKKKGKNRSIFKRIVLTILLLGVIGFLTGVGTFAYYASKAPELNKKQLKDPIASEVFGMDNKTIGTIGSVNRDYISYEDIPDKVKDAIIATEDSRFYQHYGIDPIRLGGAVLANFTRGFGSEGASTITQQVVKMSFLSNKKTLERKAQEAWLSLKLERQYTKEEIFEMYVNKIYMSDGVNGIATASKYYYGKSLDKLTLPQIALIAGIQQSPNNYNPFTNPDLAEKRKNIVLGLMYQHDKISKQEMEEAKKVPVTKGLVKNEDREKVQNKYDAFMDVVIEEVEKMGYNPFSDGLKIYTTLDPNAQEYTEKILNTNDVVKYPDDKFQAGITLLDTKTGEIRAIGGARNPKVKRGINRAVDIKRSPGSTIKPILDYGPAIENLQWSTYQQIVDEPYRYINNGPELNNWDNSYKGQMSIRRALYLSRNVPAAKTWAEVGAEKSFEFGNKLGLDLNKKKFFPSSAIGGGLEMSPLKMAGAYAAFGNNGIYNKPHAVRKIILHDGDTVVKTSPEPKIAMKDYTAYMITDMLKDVVTNPQGTGTRANIPGLPLAGKTGTTNFSDDDVQKYNIPQGASPDAWFAGYTTNYTAAVWTGYDSAFDQDGNFKYYLTPSEQKISQLIFKNLVSYVSQGKDTPDFKMPKSVEKVAIEAGTNPAQKPSANTPKDKIVYELFVRGQNVPKQISKKFDKLVAPTKLNGLYKKDTNEIIVNWDHPKAKEGVTFEISASFNNESKQSLGTTQDKTLTITNPQVAGTYTIEIVAVLGDQRSDPAVVKIEVPDPNANNVGNGNADNPGNGNNNGNNGNGNNQGGDPNNPTEPTEPTEPDDGGIIPPIDNGED